MPGNCRTSRFISKPSSATLTVELGRPLARMTSSIADSSPALTASKTLCSLAESSSAGKMPVSETAAGLFQIIRPARDLEVLRLRVGYERGGDLGCLAGKVADAVEAATGLRPEIELMLNAEIIKFGPPHKIPRTARK